MPLRILHHSPCIRRMVHGDTEGVSVTAAALTSAGVTAISIALTGTATNIGSTPLTMATEATSKLTVVDGPSTVTLSADTSIVEGG
jgi:hypothetical protein